MGSLSATSDGLVFTFQPAGLRLPCQSPPLQESDVCVRWDGVKGGFRRWLSHFLSAESTSACPRSSRHCYQLVGPPFSCPITPFTGERLSCSLVACRTTSRIADPTSSDLGNKSAPSRNLNNSLYRASSRLSCPSPPLLESGVFARCHAVGEAPCRWLSALPSRCTPVQSSSTERPIDHFRRLLPLSWAVRGGRWPFLHPPGLEQPQQDP